MSSNLTRMEKKEFTGHKEIQVLFKPEMVEDKSSRTIEGLKLESAYRILKDYKGIVTSKEYLGKFLEKFLEGQQQTPIGVIKPAILEHWLDVELDAEPEHITDQKF